MPAEKECIDILRTIRCPMGVTCPRCRSNVIIGYGNLGLCRKYRCKDCCHVFNDKSGTIFHRSRVSLRVWFFIAFMLQYKVSILELSNTLNMYYQPVFRIVKMLRSSICTNQINDRLKGIVEMDETYVNAGLKGKKGLSILEERLSRSGEEEHMMGVSHQS